MKRILVVDDEANIRHLYKAELEDEGYDVDVAKDGKETLEYLKENDVDLITLDIRMPEMDGLDLMRQIRESYRDIPIIILTAYGEYKHIDFSTWCADYYLTKSVDLTELKEKIRELLGE
jgi:DNA-binding response OmpR family regulator